MYNVMELEGFGTSLTGKAIYVYCTHTEAWIPWEFISGHTSTILITSGAIKSLEAEHTWTAVFRPSSIKEWSCIATVLRALPGPILLTFDIGSAEAPDAFLTFIDSLVLTRIWVGKGISIPTIPDAIFFPVLREGLAETYNLLTRLPGRNAHGPWKCMNQLEWSSLVETTVRSELGLVLSDVGESDWTLFWHKISDSTQPDCITRGTALVRTALAILEKCT